jgi:hypothetical protein
MSRTVNHPLYKTALQCKMAARGCISLSNNIPSIGQFGRLGTIELQTNPRQVCYD